MQDAKKEVVERLLALARLIRRKGSPDEAEAAVVYERQFERELHELTAQRELALPKIKHAQEVAA